jgi:uncharacterized membrane protein YhaH (DUF805 family)
MLDWLIHSGTGWLVKTIFCFFLVGLCWVFGQAGLQVRRGMDYAKPVRVVVPMVGLVLFLVAVLYYRDFWLLVLLIPVVMGYFGIFFKKFS